MLFRTGNFVSPPFRKINQLISEYHNRGADIINFGQAVPTLPIPQSVIREVEKSIRDPEIYKYSDETGEYDLRKSLAQAVDNDGSGGVINPEQDLIITAGANQAFLLTMLTLINSGDEVLIPSPYFTGHFLAVQLAGGVPVEVPLYAKNNFSLDAKSFLPFLSEKTRALVIVSPNNPTGAVCEPERLFEIVNLAVERNITVIQDETYKDYIFNGSRHVNIFTTSHDKEHVIVIGSFSKSLNLSGWRIGYLLGHPSFIVQALKVQEPMIICAPVIAQRALLGILKNDYHEVIERNKNLIYRRRETFYQEMSDIAQLSFSKNQGGFSAFVEVEGCSDSFELAQKLIVQAHVATIPGISFGKAGEGYLRFSYGSTVETLIVEGCRRLRRFFS